MGILALVVREIPVKRKRDVVRIGTIEASIQQRERIRIPWMYGAAAVVAGVVLIGMGARRKG